MTKQLKGRLACAGMLATVLAMLLAFGYANGFDSVKDTTTVLITTIVYLVGDVWRGRSDG